MEGNMPPTPRKELQEDLFRYATETLDYIDTVTDFCEKSSKWRLRRESEVKMMKDIKDRADHIDLNIRHVTRSENRGKAFVEYMRSKVRRMTADSRLAKLEKELAAVLDDTLEGLEKLHRFLDAVEKLAVTSLHVFTEANRELGLPAGIDLQRVQVVVIIARRICPLLLKFKRDDGVFFLPRLQNVEVLAYQLDQYVQTTKKVCDSLDTRDFSSKINMKAVAVDSSQDDDQRMLCHINQLEAIRMNQSFRTVFLFQEMSSVFIAKFGDRQARMLQFLKELEESAVQLDRMNKGAKISSVAGSSLGAVGSVLSIVGLALIPVTAGVSLALTMTGIGMGVTSGVNSLVTTATETGVNHTQQKKANEAFKGFMEDMQVLQDCLEEAVQKGMRKKDVIVGVGKMVFAAGGIVRKINSLINKVLRSSAAKVAPDIPDIGQAAVKGPLALSKSARAGLVNALFLGLDVFFICKDSVSLSKGSETKVSRFIRARAALWRSEMDSWQRIRDSLRDGLLTSEENWAIVEKPFYPEKETGGNVRNDNGS